jgi:tetratricopeptide (TPR) repeat protein
MKNLIALLFFVLCFAGFTHADDTKYVQAMKSNFMQMDSMKTLENMTEITNSFLRIAAAEKDKWLPYYYASYMSVITSFTDTVKSKKDGYLDEAEKFLAVADSLAPNESENYVLKGLICQARLQVDPMSRYMKYMQSMNSNFEKAITLDPKNPRPEYLMGMTLFYTPEQFGGGAKAAKPVFENSLKKFNEFVPRDELMPHWGKEQLEGFLKQIPQ